LCVCVCVVVCVSGDAVACVTRESRLGRTSASRRSAERDAFKCEKCEISDFHTFASQDRRQSLQSAPAGLVPRHKTGITPEYALTSDPPSSSIPLRAGFPISQKNTPHLVGEGVEGCARKLSPRAAQRRALREHPLCFAPGMSGQSCSSREKTNYEILPRVHRYRPSQRL
jgi:hypothetical protein